MGSGINQTNTHAGPVASMMVSHENDDDGSLRRMNTTIANDRLERSQLTLSSMASGLHTSGTFPWQSSYCPTSRFLDSGFSSSTPAIPPMDAHRQPFYNFLDRDLARRTMSLSRESISQLQLERYNRFRLDSTLSGSSSGRSSDIDVRSLVNDPRAGTSLDTSLDSTKRQQCPLGGQLRSDQQALLDGKFHTSAGDDNASASLAARAYQELMLQANQIPIGPTVGRFAGVVSRYNSEIGGGSRFGGLDKIDYTHSSVHRRGETTPAMPTKDGKNGGIYLATPGCGGLSLTSAVRNSPPIDDDTMNYHAISTGSRGLPALQSDAGMPSYHGSPKNRSSDEDHLDHRDKKASSPRSRRQDDDSMDHSQGKVDEGSRSQRKHEANSPMSAKKNKRGEGSQSANKKRKRDDQSTADRASPGLSKTQNSRDKEEACQAFLLEEENRLRETRQKHAESLCMDNPAALRYHPQLRQIDEERRHLHHAILADQECFRSHLLRTTMPVLTFPYPGSRYAYSTRALLENVSSAMFPPRGHAASGSMGVMFGAHGDPVFGCRLSQALPSGEEQLPEETYSGVIVERPYMDSNAPGHAYPSAREAEGSRDFATRRRCFPLHISEDENNLSSYQVLARKQIEVFEASLEEARTNAQGRNRPIQAGEIGIRCRHCAKIPPKDRVTGAVYYPKKLDGVYQTAQKMAVNHLADRCQEIPEEIKERLKTLKETTRSSDGGGKRYWAEALRTLGVRELEAGGLVWNE